MIYFILCYLLSVGAYLIMLKVSFKMNLRQTEREEGLESHKRKSGTLTMGGIVFSFIPTILLIFHSKASLTSVLLGTAILCYFLLGFVDDIKVVRLKNNTGLSPKLRLIIELILGFIITIWLSMLGNDTTIGIGKLYFNFGIFYCVIISIYLTGMVNSFNLTDGIDTLLTSLSIILSLGLLFICFKDKNYEVAFFLILLVISLMAFYVLNYFNAKMFMGNTGSLVLGGGLSVSAIMLNAEIVFFIMCIPLIFETISDIVQVVYFKISKGKRVFKMAPFHHHLEILGYSEKLITALFSLVEIIFVFIALIIGGYF